MTAEGVLDTQDRRQGDVMNHTVEGERVKTIALKPNGYTITLPALSACAIECGRR
jgi:hypothetical protein